MAHLNLRDRVIETTIAYVGAVESGVASNLVHVKRNSERGRSGEVQTTVIDGGRVQTLVWRPRDGAKLNDCELAIKLISTEGVDTEALQQVIVDADGLVLVLESDPTALERNERTMKTVRDALARSPDKKVPVVVQVNQRDDVEDEHLDDFAETWPRVNARTTKGDGVMETLQRAVDDVVGSMQGAAGDPTEPRPRGTPRAEGNPLLGALRQILQVTVSEQIAALETRLVDEIEKRMASRESARESDTRDLSAQLGAIAPRMDRIEARVVEMGEQATAALELATAASERAAAPPPPAAAMAPATASLDVERLVARVAGDAQSHRDAVVNEMKEYRKMTREEVARAVTRSVDGLALFDEVARERGQHLPLVIQANKQDQPGALSGVALLATLDRSAIPVVEAIASDGIGVVDTFVAAVRAAVRAIQARVEGGHVRVAIQRAETAEALLDKLSVEEIDPEWALEMMLEEASNAFAVGDRLDLDVHDTTVLAEPVSSVGSSNDVDASRPTRKPERLADAPVLPTEHVPTGFIWPAHTGRAALRAIGDDPGMKQRVALDDDGSTRMVVGDYVLCTSRDRRFATSEAARQALVRAARERTLLGTLLAPQTVLVAQPTGDDASWLWTIFPRMPTIAELVASRDRADLAQSALLALFGGALADALKLEASHGLALDLSPRSFGVLEGAVRYLGEVSISSTVVRDTGSAVTEALANLALVCAELGPTVTVLESAIAAKFSADERANLARSATWVDAGSLPPSVRDARTRIQQALNHGRNAA